VTPTDATHRPSLSVVIPVHNGGGWIGRCIERVVAAVERSPFQPAEIVVVDDGSTDATALEAKSVPTDIPITVLSGPNQGRFRARRLGLEQAAHDYVLLVDTRVFVDPDALRFVAGEVGTPETDVWTSHVVANTDESGYAGFWQAIEHVAWRRYWRHPSTTSFGIDEFDYYPKGTTALLAPRQLLIESFDAFEPTITDWTKANDDTAVLRWVAERVPINISPGYGSTYHARTDLRGFLRHANHRGTVLIDGYLRPGTRFAVPIVAVLALSPVGAVVAARHPRLALSLAVGASCALGVVAHALGARREDSVTLAKWAVPFGVAYLGGMWRGALLRARGMSAS
jgi:glycosyltransferase involved in cell wall biosynthesis